MKKIFTLVFLMLSIVLLAPFISAVPNLEIKKVEKVSVVVTELNNPAIFELEIDNKGQEGYYEIYSLAGIFISPKEKFLLPRGTSKLTIQVLLREDAKWSEGVYSFEYRIRSETFGTFRDTLPIKIVPLSSVLDIKAGPVNLGDSVAKVTITNKENLTIEGLNLKFSSPLFSGTKTITINPLQTISFDIPINLERKDLRAGQYILTTEATIGSKKSKIESVVNYVEREYIATEERTSGFLVKKTQIKKINNGNIPVRVVIDVKKDLISRLFTVNFPEGTVFREGFYTVFIWEKEIAPGESFEIETTTNYIFPLVIIILIIFAGVLAKIYSQNAIALNKKVSLVKTKGGEFALKINLHVKARSFVTNIRLIDTLPGMAKLYEEFGKKPDKIDHEMRKLTWKIDKLTAGEERIYSYIIYSKIKVVGKLELPRAVAIFEKDDRIQEVLSNKAIFLPLK